jgi:cysteinyl-tRNA synthetase
VYPIAPYNVNNDNVVSLKDAKNFLYLINPGLFPDKDAFLDALRGTNYDILIIDLFYEDVALTAEEVASLKKKQDGGTRLLIAYMSIGEAEDYRYYWQPEWKINPPEWLEEENPDWPGNYKVRYWNTTWQRIIYGNNDSYLKKILDAGFNGVYLDVIDAYEYFEDQGG